METNEKTKPAISFNSIDRQTIDNIRYYSMQNSALIDARLKELNEEWDIERVLEINAGILALSGSLLGSLNKRWLILPGIAAAFIAQYSVQGWCPPVSLLRKFGFRTRKEIEREKYALKTLRGDFDDIYDTADAWRAVRD